MVKFIKTIKSHGHTNRTVKPKTMITLTAGNLLTIVLIVAATFRSQNSIIYNKDVKEHP